MMLVVWYNRVVMGNVSASGEPGSMVLLTRLAKQVYRRSTEELLGIHMRLVMALSYLRDHDGAPQQELAETLCMDANNVVLLLNELEDLGHVARRRDPDDRRRHRVELTESGRRKLVEAERAQETIEDDVLQGLDPEDRATLRRLLTLALSGAELQATERELAAGAAALGPQASAQLRTTQLRGQRHASTRNLQRHDRVDLHLRTPWKRSDADRDPRWGLVREERPVDLIDLRESRQVSHVDRHPYRARQARPRRLADGAQVLQTATCLLSGAVADDLARLRIQRYLA
jgi:DNA-binding MarR family transcriptional regulator